jgi:hypothetical protein
MIGVGWRERDREGGGRETGRGERERGRERGVKDRNLIYYVTFMINGH